MKIIKIIKIYNYKKIKIKPGKYSQHVDLRECGVGQ
jgi:hypothetical protein